MKSLARSARLREVDPAPPDWEVAFGRKAPVEVDLGCGRGDYAWQRARACREVNVVALDSRKKWIDRLRERGNRQGVDNLRAIRCDVTSDLPILFAPKFVSAFTIHHPDPWWKKRHRKRRLVQTHLVEQLARLLVPGGWVFLQTDVPDMADQIRSTFAANPLFRSTDAVAIQATRMGGLQSHREKKCQQLGIPVTRLAYVLENKERIAS